MSFESYTDAPRVQPQAHSSTSFVRVNLLVPASLRKEWKVVALASDKTLTDFIIEAMQHQISRAKQTEISTNELD